MREQGKKVMDKQEEKTPVIQEKNATNNQETSTNIKELQKEMLSTCQQIRTEAIQLNKEVSQENIESLKCIINYGLNNAKAFPDKESLKYFFQKNSSLIKDTCGKLKDNCIANIDLCTKFNMHSFSLLNHYFQHLQSKTK